MKSLTDIKIQMDFEISPELVELYRQSTHSAFIGYDTPLTLAEAAEKIHQYASTKHYGKFERIAIMKIWQGDVLVGFSLPRLILQREYEGFKIEDTGQDWYRTGTIYVTDSYRGKGIVAKAVHLLRQQYPNLIWGCKDENLSSKRAAEKAGFKYSHHVYFKADKQWSFSEEDDSLYGYVIFKCGEC